MKAYYINLDHRTDRRTHFEAEIARVGIEAERVPGIMPTDENTVGIAKRFVGKGCYLAHKLVMEKIIAGGESAMVFEDDTLFCVDFPARWERIQAFMADNPWDVFWLGGTWHNEPRWHLKGHPHMPECGCELGKDWEPTETPNIVRTYGCFCTYAYVVNIKAAEWFQQKRIETSTWAAALDWADIWIQPQMLSYAFTPGCCRQLDGNSDIRDYQNFSIFSKLGPHWYKDRL